MRLPFFRTGAGERADPLFVLGELGRGTRPHHLAVVEHIGAIGDLNRGADILLHQQHGDALLAGRHHHAEDFLHDQRRETLAWLVQQQ